MPILVRALSAISESTNHCNMPLSRASTIYSTISDVELLDAVSVINPHNHIIEISARPEFYIFTSLLWNRTSNRFEDRTRQPDGLSGIPNEAGLSNLTLLDESLSDLGLLRFHQDRLAAAAEALQWRNICALEKSEKGLNIIRSSITIYLQCLPDLPSDRIERRKLRLMVSKLGYVTIDSTIVDCSFVSEHSHRGMRFLPISLDLCALDHIQDQLDGEVVREDDLCQVLLDTRSTRPSLFTTHKTSYRVQYNAARARVKIASCAPVEKEVLVYNKNGEIMEASLCTVYLFRNDRWITPATICGGNVGVTRRLALERQLCQQGTIEIAELVDGEKIWLSNAVRGFFVGQIRLERQSPALIPASGASP